MKVLWKRNRQEDGLASRPPVCFHSNKIYTTCGILFCASATASAGYS